MKKGVKIALSLIIILAIVCSAVAVWLYRYYNFSDYKVSKDIKDYEFTGFVGQVLADEGWAVIPDVRIFTLYAFLNSIGGFDEEYGDSMTTQRAELRADLEQVLSMLDESKIKHWQEFYTKHELHHYAYVYYTLTLGTPPNFNYIVDKERLKDIYNMVKLKKFHGILTEFYNDANIGDLYKNKYQKLMEDEVLKYSKDAINRDINSMYEYLRLNPLIKDLISVIIIPNPFDSHYSAYAVDFNDTLYVIDGPGSNDGGLNIHEYLHKFINPIVGKYIDENKSKFDRILDENKDKSIVSGSYRKTDTFVNECLVRAIDYRIALAQEKYGDDTEKIIRSKISQDETGGLVLVRPFYEKLEKYEKDSGMEIDAFIYELLSEDY